MPSITLLIVVLLALILLFFFLREVNCWYWKINERIELAHRQNMLLDKILHHVAGESSSSKIIVNAESIINEQDDVYNTMTELEKNEADKFIKYGLKNGDSLVINKKTRKIDRYDQNEWEGIKINHQQDEWLIISKKNA